MSIEAPYHYTNPNLQCMKKDLWDILKGNPGLLAKISLSILSGKKRSFTDDAEKVSKLLEPPTIIGSGNVPTTGPVLIACNHPETLELVLAAIRISEIIHRIRNSDIRWYLSENAPERDASGLKKRIVVPLKSFIEKKFGETYTFIQVPTHQKSNTIKRGKSALVVCEYLKSGGIVAMTPEGDCSRKPDELNEFFTGVGAIAKRTESSNVVILPVGIRRDESGKQIISFANPIDPKNYSDKYQVTNTVRTAISHIICKKSIPSLRP